MADAERKIRTIVTAVGPAFWDDPVLPASIDLARRCGANLHVVRAFDPPRTADGSGADSDREDDRLAARREDMLVGLRGQVESLGGEEAECHVIVGPPDEMVAEVAEQHEADLVCVGAARLENLGLRLLGTKAERIIARSRRPVLVLRTSIDRPIRRVLVSMDPSPASERVFDVGRGVISTLFDGDNPFFRCLTVVWEQGALVPMVREADDDGHVGESLERFVASRGSARAEAAVRTGMPAGAILAEVREWQPDIVVLGTSARSGTARLLMGSVSASVLRDLAGNAIVVPPRIAGDS